MGKKEEEAKKKKEEQTLPTPEATAIAEGEQTKVEISELTGLPQTPAPEKPQEGEKPPVATSTPEGAKEGEKTHPPAETLPPEGEKITLEEVTKLRTQANNLHSAIAEEERLLASLRSEKKLLKEELGTKEPSEEEGEKITDIDPEVEKTIVSVIGKERTKTILKELAKAVLEEERGKEKEMHWAKSYEKFKTEHPDISDFDEKIKQFFAPAMEENGELRDEFRASENPAKFAYEQALKIKEKLLKPEIEAAEKKTKEALLAELKKQGQPVPVSLSSVPGGSPGTETLNPLQKEISELTT